MWHQVWKYKSSPTSHGFLNCPDKANNHRLRKLLNLQIFNSFNSHSSVYPLSDILTHDTVHAQHNLPHSTDHKLTPRLRSSPDLFQINGSSTGFPILNSCHPVFRGSSTRPANKTRPVGLWRMEMMKVLFSVVSHWSRLNESWLSLVESFIVLLRQCVLCHKEPARRIQRIVGFRARKGPLTGALLP